MGTKRKRKKTIARRRAALKGWRTRRRNERVRREGAASAHWDYWAGCDSIW